MRYFLHLAYRGTAYKGWQRQGNTDLSIQQKLENDLSKMMGTPISIMGCGRTDSGVHARQYFAHFDYDGEWSYDPVERLNRILPDDISVFEVIPVHPMAHTRYDAIKRSYEYHLHLDPNPFLSPFSSYHNKSLVAIENMKIGLESLLRMEDFRYLCLTPDRSKHTLCNIFEARMEVSTDQKRFVFYFTANRFLKSMIRIIVGRLLLVGEGKISLKELDDLNIGKIKLSYPVMAFPQGLHLTKIEYPYLTREVKSM